MSFKKFVSVLLFLFPASFAFSADHSYKVVIQLTSFEGESPQEMLLFVKSEVEASIRMQKRESAEAVQSRVTVSEGTDFRHVNLIFNLARYDASGALVSTDTLETQVPLDATTQVLERQSSGGSEQVVVTVSLHPTGATY